MEIIKMDFKTKENLVNKLFQECLEIQNKKGPDYAGTTNALSNFKRNAEQLGLTKYQVWAIYFNKHIDAIMMSIKRCPSQPQVESEPLTERIRDAINYLALLLCLLEEEK